VFKVVIDINLFVSGVINKSGNPARLLQLWRDNTFLLIISEQMLEDIKRVLHYPRIKNKYNLKDKEIKQTVDTIKKFAIVFPDLIDLDVIKEDPDDNKVLACAIAAKADRIVSGDRHLLKLGVFGNIPILTAKDFLDSIESNI